MILGNEIPPYSIECCKGGYVLYEIYWKDRPVGKVEVTQEGLYYRFCCTCTLPDGEFYRVSVTDGVSRYDLGLCVPDGKNFVCNTRLPRKLLKGEKLSFTLLGKDTPLVSVPIATGVPFDYLHKLETAHLLITDGQPGIVIDPIQDPQDSDPTRERLNRSE